MEKEVTYGKTSRGFPKLIFDNHFYILNQRRKTNRGIRENWKCVNPKCTGTLVLLPCTVWTLDQRITGSLAGDVFRLKSTTDNTTILNKIFNRKQWKGTEAAKQYGKFHEEVALARYEQVTELKVGEVQPCGLSVCLEEGVLGSSPDGFIGENGLLEVKCPYSLKDGEPKDWPEYSKANSSLIYKNGELKLKENHNHYYQIIMHIYATGRQWCDYVVWTPKGHFCQRVTRDASTNALWEQMKTKLTFWIEDLGPELLDSRFKRGYLNYKCPELRRAARDKKSSKKSKQ